MLTKKYFVYLLSNDRNTVLYTGFTGNFSKRIEEHKRKTVKGFTKKYNVGKLVYYEIFDDPTHAILREKQIKAGSRQKKINLILRKNPEWKDLSKEIF